MSPLISTTSKILHVEAGPFIHFEAFVHKSIIRVLPISPPLYCPHYIAIYDCTTIVQCKTAPRPPRFFDIHRTVLIITIPCEGQVEVLSQLFIPPRTP